MGFFKKPKVPDPVAIQQAAEERAEQRQIAAEQRAEERAKREREEAERKAGAELRAKMRVQQGRAATWLTDERTLLTGRSLLGG
jgi:hypothetical protein